MSLNHLIVKSFKEIVAGNATLNADLPGDLCYGRADTRTNRPFAAMTVLEKNREYNSGGGSLVEYEVTIRVYADQRTRTVGQILADLAAVFNRLESLPAVPDDRGELICCVPIGGPIEDDDAEEFGKDVVTGSAAWLLLIEECELVLAD